MKRVVPLAICMIAALQPAAAQQQNERVWPSRQAGAPTGPEDPPFGRGGSCRYQGERIAQGDTVCIDRDGRGEQALCGMSYNVTSWLWQNGTCQPENR